MRNLKAQLARQIDSSTESSILSKKVRKNSQNIGSTLTCSSLEMGNCIKNPVKVTEPTEESPIVLNKFDRANSRRRLSLGSVTHEKINNNQLYTEPPVRQRRLTLHDAVLDNSATGLRLSIEGHNTAIAQSSYSNKICNINGNQLEKDVVSHGIGYACHKGLKPESPNQDDFCIIGLDELYFFGVFDGHGLLGEQVSNFVQQHLIQYIYEIENFQENLPETLKNAFSKTQNELIEMSKLNIINADLSGSTATVCVWQKTLSKLTVAHVGDSRAVLVTIKPKDEVSVKALTIDHKPTLFEERQRIEASGGQIRRVIGDIPYRVYVEGRPYPGLAMSRAFGDLLACEVGVIAEPSIDEYDIDLEYTQVLVVCSDGVWEFISDEEAGTIVSEKLKNGTPQIAADELTKVAWDRWIKEENDIVDDITVEVIVLNKT